MNKSPGWVNTVYAAIFLDLLGFGMLIPDIQLRAAAMKAPGWLIGLMLASTFLVQVPLSPHWGSLSDRIGRKPVLLACTAFSAAGMLVYGFAAAIPMMIFSRVLSGFGGANVAIANALIADGTPTETRTVALGRVGAAVTLGLIGGPVVGGYVGDSLGSHWVGWLAGAGSALGFLLIWLFIPKQAPTKAAEPRGRTLFFEFGLLKEIPQVRRVALVASIAWFSLATLEGTFGRLLDQTMGFGKKQFGIVFGYESFVGFVVQAFLLAWIVTRVKDFKLLRIGYLLQGLGLAITPFAFLFPVPGLWMIVLLAISTIYALGAGVAGPTVNSIASNLTPPERQGELFGLLQGTRSIGFIVGPILGGALFDWWYAAPYMVAGLTCIAAALILRKG
ncbi:MAG: MFS transporter [Fimbriimonadaceae bacterium]